MRLTMDLAKAAVIVAMRAKGWPQSETNVSRFAAQMVERHPIDPPAHYITAIKDALQTMDIVV